MAVTISDLELLAESSVLLEVTVAVQVYTPKSLLPKELTMAVTVVV